MKRALVFVCVLFAGVARATVTEPNGAVVPGPSSKASETSLKSYFSTAGETIDWQNDAHVTPALFSPLCDFTATFVLNQANEKHALRWYNADPTAVAPPAASYEVVPAGAALGVQVTSTAIRGNAAYKGGLVGFVLDAAQPHYSEQRWNPACSGAGCATTTPWALALTYKSTLHANAYYLAFEDAAVSGASFNNDGDFNDDVFLVSGLSCDGAGQPCDTGQKGQCATGLTDCDAAGGIACRSVNGIGVEVCDGIDNDCDGAVDDGAQCSDGRVCDRGRCVAPCSNVEFPCAAGTVCTDGLCVDPACNGVMCPDGQVCVGGACRGACDGVVCPRGQACRVGRCVDPCAGVVCPSGRVCAGGVCVTSCACQACGGGAVCGGDGRCVEPSCADAGCPMGAVCVAGSCVDRCNGAVCPAGQACRAGECVDAPAPDDLAVAAPVDSGVIDDPPADDPRPRDLSTGGTAPKRPGGASGCRCDVGAGEPGALPLYGFLVAALALRSRARAWRAAASSRRDRSRPPR